MNGNELTREAEIIYELICRIGTITTAQAEKVLNGRRCTPEGIIKSLCMKRYTKWINEVYSIPFYKSQVDRKAVADLWVMLDLISTDNGTVQIEALEQIIEGSGIIDFTYIQDNAAVINMLFIGANDYSKVIASKERFYDFTNLEKGNEKKAGVIYMYVTDSKEMAAKIQDENLSLPHKIALIEGDLDNNPSIKYL